MTIKKIRILKTVNLYASFLCCGMGFTVFGPTLIDLMHRVDTDVKHISIVFIALYGGLLFGGVSGAIYLDMTNKQQLTYTVFNLIASVSLFGISWSKNISLLIAMISIFGVAAGVIVIGSNTRILDFWGKESKPFFQALYLSNNIGCLICPLVAAPFLGHYNVSTETDDSRTTYSNEIDIQSDTKNKTLINTISIMDNDSKANYIFIIIGSLFLFMTLFSLILTILYPVDEKNQGDVLSDSNNRSFIFKFVLVSLGCLLVSTIIGAGTSYPQMLTTYIIKGPLHLKISTGSYMTSVYYVSGTISGVFAVLFTIKFSILLLVIINLLLMVLGTINLFLLAENHEWALWVSTILLGIALSTLFSVCISWLEKYIVITNKIVAINHVGTSLTGMFLPYIIGQYIVDNPSIFKYTNLLCCIIIVVIAFVLHLVLRKMPDKYTNNFKT